MNFTFPRCLTQTEFVITRYVVGAIAVGGVLRDTFTANKPVTPVLKAAWPIIVLFFSIIDFALYVWSCRPKQIGSIQKRSGDDEAKRIHHDRIADTWKKIAGSGIHSVGGDALGIISAMIVTRRNLSTTRNLSAFQSGPSSGQSRPGEGWRPGGWNGTWGCSTARSVREASKTAYAEVVREVGAMWPHTKVGVGLGTIAALVAIAGCGRTGARGDETSWDAAALQLPPAVQPQELPNPDSPGAKLMEQYCSACHGIPSPASHAAEDWIPTVRRMFLRMEHMSQMGGMHGMMGGGRRPMMSGPVAVPSASEQEQISSYLQAHAMKSISPNGLRSPSDPAAALFVRTCSRCHALPDPAQHPGAKWPQVVERMRGNMRKMNVTGINDEQAREISSCLQRIPGGSVGR